MIKLGRPTVRSSHVSRLTTCPFPTTWQMQHCLPPRWPSVCPYARLVVAALSAASSPVVRAVRISRRLPVACSPVPDRFSDSRRDAAAIDFPLFPWSCVDVSGGHLSTCCLMKMAAASLLHYFRMNSAHRVLQPSVTVEINFLWF